MKNPSYHVVLAALIIILSACSTRNSEPITSLATSKEEVSIPIHDQFTSSNIDVAPSFHISSEAVSSLGEESSNKELPFLSSGSNSPSSTATQSSTSVESSSKADIVLELIPIQQKSTFVPDRPNPIETPEQLAKNQQLRDYMIELRAALTPEEYAYISLDYVAFEIGIYTPQLDRIIAVVSQHPNPLIPVQIFPESFSRQDVSDVIDEINNLPFVKNNLDKMAGVSSSARVDRYGTISIQLLKPIPKLEEWVKTADYGPIKIVFKGHEKFAE